MDNLKEIGISEKTITDMIEVNGVSVVDDLDTNYENAYKIIMLLKKLNIKKIDSLLVERIDLFFKDYQNFIDTLKDKNLIEISNYINEDLSNVDDIFF